MNDEANNQRGKKKKKTQRGEYVIAEPRVNGKSSQ